MIDICMVVTSELDRDPRVQKEALSAHNAGYNVLVICRSYSGPALDYQVLPLNIARPEKRLFKYFERIWFNLTLILKLIQYRPHLIHANDLDTLPAALLAGKIIRKSVLFDAHEYFSTAGRDVGALGSKLLFWLERTLVKKADKVVTVSQHLAKSMATDLQIEQPTIVMNAAPYIDTSAMDAGEWATEFTGKKIVLFHGRYVQDRSLPEAILAAKYLPDDIVMVFRGYGPLEDELRALVNKENLSKKVHFVPPVPMFDLVRSAVGADIGIFPCNSALRSKLYAAPNKVFEYMMAGLPFVATDTPEIRRLLGEHDIGAVFIPDDPQDTARAIVELLEKPAELAKMQERCLEIAHSFSWEVEGAKLLQVYAQLLERTLPMESSTVNTPLQNVKS